MSPGNQSGTPREVVITARWGKTDFKQLEEFRKKINQAANADFDEFCVQTSKELAKRFLAKVTKRTPVGIYHGKERRYKIINKQKGVKAGDVMKTKSGKIRYEKDPWGRTGGTLRRGWTIGNITKKANGYEIEIINPTEYASYVEFGHRQTPGRYVPQIGKQLKNTWASGKFMMTVTEQEIQNTAPGLIEKKFEKFLREVMSGDK